MSCKRKIREFFRKRCRTDVTRDGVRDWEFTRHGRLRWSCSEDCCITLPAASSRPFLQGEQPMKRTLVAVVSLCAALLCAPAAVSQNAFTPDQVKYGPPP